jgi:hypothetical protein
MQLLEMPFKSLAYSSSILNGEGPASAHSGAGADAPSRKSVMIKSVMMRMLCLDD